MQTLTPAILRGLVIGMVLVIISLPVLFAVHGMIGLGSPPVDGLILLGSTVAVALAAANAIGAFMGEARGNPLIAALVGLTIGVAACIVVAPFYGGMVVDGMTHEALGVAWGERDRLVQGTQDAVEGGASESASQAWDAARAGRLREQLGHWQQEAQNANTPAARRSAAQRARAVAAELTPKGLEVLKSGAAKLSAFSLLLWAIVAPPLGAAFECRRARPRR